MRKLSLLLSVTIALFASCKEIGPAINTGNVQAAADDTTYVISPVPQADARIVLVEEFTGVSCPNCPAGHEIIKNLKNNYPGRLVAISLYKYGTPLTDKRPTTADDFRDSIANSIEQAIYDGSVSALPSAGIDRIAHDNLKVLDRNKWSKAVTDRFNISSPVNISVTSSLNDADKTVKVKFTVTFTQEISEQVYYSIAIVQDSIIDAQEHITLGEIHDYQHDHVLRSFISANGVNGVELDADGAYEPGRVFVRTVTGQLKDHWDPEHCKVVVFLHYSGANKEVLQAREIDLK